MELIFVAFSAFCLRYRHSQKRDARLRQIVWRSMWAQTLLLAAGAGAGAEECAAPAPGQRRLSLWLRSERNATGHLHSQLRVLRAKQPLDLQLHMGDCVANDRPDGRFLEIQVTESPEPAAGYEAFPGVGRYKMHVEGATWAEGRAACEAEGGHLVVLNSEAEAQVLVQLFERARNATGLSDSNHAFIGFHDFYVEGQFVTIFGNRIEDTGFTRWSGPNQPDNYGFGVNSGSDCGGVHRNGGLNDLPCNWKCIFFCEQPIL